MYVLVGRNAVALATNNYMFWHELATSSPEPRTDLESGHVKTLYQLFA